MDYAPQVPSTSSANVNLDYESVGPVNRVNQFSHFVQQPGGAPQLPPLGDPGFGSPAGFGFSPGPGPQLPPGSIAYQSPSHPQLLTSFSGASGAPIGMQLPQSAQGQPPPGQSPHPQQGFHGGGPPNVMVGHSPNVTAGQPPMHMMMHPHDHPGEGLLPAAQRPTHNHHGAALSMRPGPPGSMVGPQGGGPVMGGMPPGPPYSHYQFQGGPPGMHPGVPTSGPPQMQVHAPMPYEQYASAVEWMIYEMNKRLVYRTDEPETVADWWIAFANEFFDHDAQLSVKLLMDDAPKRYTIGRTLIPRYFRTMFEGGVKDLIYVPRSSFRVVPVCTQPGVVTLECDNFLTISRHEKPTMADVYTESRLEIEIVDEPYDKLRIRHWSIEIRGYQEFVPRHHLRLNEQDSDMFANDITKQGLTSATLKYLKLCVILEPMSQLMSKCKTHKEVSPRYCLWQTTSEMHQNIVDARAAEENQRRLAAAQAQAAAAGAGPGGMMPPGGPGGPPMPGQSMPHGMPNEPQAEPAKPARKRRNRKSAAGTANKKKNTAANSASPAPGAGPGSSGTPGCSTPGGNMPNAPSFPQLPTNHAVDVMVVQEPTLMGGPYGDEDERQISRLENTLYDPTAVTQPGQPPHGMHMHMMRMSTPGGQMPPGFEGGLGPGVMWTPGGPMTSQSGPGMTRASPHTPHTPQSRIGTPSHQQTTFTPLGGRGGSGSLTPTTMSGGPPMIGGPMGMMEPSMMGAPMPPHAMMGQFGPGSGGAGSARNTPELSKEGSIMTSGLRQGIS